MNHVFSRLVALALVDRAVVIEVVIAGLEIERKVLLLNNGR